MGDSQKMHFYSFISENGPNQYEYNLLKKTWVSVKFLYMNWTNITWAIRQKGKSQNVCYKKIKYAKYSKHFLPPDMHLHVCVSEVKKCLFYIKFGVLCFLVTPILRFSLLPIFPFWSYQVWWVQAKNLHLKKRRLEISYVLFKGNQDNSMKN